MYFNPIDCKKVLIYTSGLYNIMVDINAIVQGSKAIAMDSVPAGGSEYTDAIVQIFTANPGKKFSGRDIKKLFADQDVEIKNPSNVLFQLMKQGKLTRPKTGWYELA